MTWHATNKQHTTGMRRNLSQNGKHTWHDVVYMIMHMFRLSWGLNMLRAPPREGHYPPHQTRPSPPPQEICNFIQQVEFQYKFPQGGGGSPHPSTLTRELSRTPSKVRGGARGMFLYDVAADMLHLKSHAHANTYSYMNDGGAERIPAQPTPRSNT